MRGPRRSAPLGPLAAPLAGAALVLVVTLAPGCGLFTPGPGGEPSPAAAGVSASGDYLAKYLGERLGKLEETVSKGAGGMILDGAFALATALGVGAAAAWRQRKRNRLLEEKADRACALAAAAQPREAP